MTQINFHSRKLSRDFKIKAEIEKISKIFRLRKLGSPPWMLRRKMYKSTCVHMCVHVYTCMVWVYTCNYTYAHGYIHIVESDWVREPSACVKEGEELNHTVIAQCACQSWGHKRSEIIRWEFGGAIIIPIIFYWSFTRLLLTLYKWLKIFFKTLSNSN